MRLWSEEPIRDDRAAAYVGGLEIRKRPRMVGLSPRRSGIRVGCCQASIPKQVLLHLKPTYITDYWIKVTPEQLSVFDFARGTNNDVISQQTLKP